MSRGRQVLACFARMQPEHLRKLTPAQKDELLLALHAKLNEGVLDRPLKHKIITKHRDISYKRYVRARMPAIISTLTASIAIRPSLVRHNHHVPGIDAKTNFKSGSVQARLRKMEKFDMHFRELADGSGRQEVTCSICLETLVRPVLTVCGHAFCFQCLDESLLFSSNCPNCRENIKGQELTPCALLDKLIKQASNSSSLTLSSWGAFYSERLKRFQQWRRKREVELRSLRAGMVLDVRDTENIWCQGTVLEVEWGNGREKPTSVLVHFNRWDNIYNEIIELPSLRLAPHHFFSSRRDIPHYNLSLSDNNMRGLVISGNSNPNPQPATIEVDSSSEQELSNHLQLVPQPFPQERFAIAEFLNNWNLPPMFRFPLQAQPELQNQVLFDEQPFYQESENVFPYLGEQDGENQQGEVEEVDVRIEDSMQELEDDQA